MKSPVFLEGKKYILIKDASLLTSYSKDYIGQLAREGKILSTRVGKKWFVEEGSILNYKNTPTSFDFSKNFQGKEKLILESERFIPIAEASALTSYSKDYIGQLARFNKIESKRDGKKWLVSEASLVKYKNTPTSFDFSKNFQGRERKIEEQIETNRKVYLINKGLSNTEKFPKTIQYLHKNIFSSDFNFAKTLAPFAIALVLTIGSFSLKQTGLEKISSTANVISSVTLPLETTSSFVYTSISSFFDTAIFSPLARFFSLPEVVQPTYVVERSTPQVVVQPAPKIVTTPPQVIQNNPVVERIIERVVGGNSVSKEYVDLSLQQLSNKLASEFSKLSSGTGGAVTNIYNQIAGSQKIDNLYNTAISSPRITGGTISGTGIVATSLSADSITTPNLSAESANITSLTIASGTFSNLVLTNSTTTNATTTNAFITNALVTNATTTNAFITSAVTTNLLASYATTTNLFSTTASSTNLFSTLASFGSLSVDNFTTTGTNLFSGTGTSTFAGDILVSGLSSWRYLTAPNFVATSTTATSTFAGSVGIGTTSPSQLFSVAGSAYFTGGLGIGVATTSAGVLETSGDVKVGGNLFVNGNSTTLGETISDTLVVNSTLGSSLVPNQNIVYDLGSPSFYWRNVYTGTITANSISAASTSIAGTNSGTFTINADNVTGDTEDADLIFFRGVVTPNALLSWKSTTNRFELNQPTFIQNADNTNNQTTLALRGTTGTTADIFNISSSTGTSFLNLTYTGNFGLGTTSPYEKLSVAGSGYFDGGTVTAANFVATSSFSAPTLTLTGASINSLLSTNASGVVTATSTPTFGNFNATSTNATSTIAGGLAIGTNYFNVLQNGSVGIGLSAPIFKLDVNGTIGNSSGAVAINAGGTNQNVVLTPSGNGDVVASVAADAGEGFVVDFNESQSGGRKYFYMNAGTGGSPQQMIIGGQDKIGYGGKLVFNQSGVASQVGLQNGYGNNLLSVNTTEIGLPTTIKIGGSVQGWTGYTDQLVQLIASAGVLAQQNGTNAQTFQVFNTYTNALNYERAILGWSNNVLNIGTQNSGTGVARSLALLTGSTTRMTIDTSGNVGVGTTTPYSKLSISNLSTDSVAPLFTISSSTASATTTLFTVLNSGNVGIGTTSPQYKLDVYGSVSLGDSTALAPNQAPHRLSGDSIPFAGGGAYGNYGSLIFNANANYGGGRRYLISNAALAGSHLAFIRSVDSNTDPVIGSDGVITSGTADLVMSSIGNIGIGTTSPTNNRLIVGGTNSPQIATNVTRLLDVFGVINPYGGVGEIARFAGYINTETGNATAIGVRVDQPVITGSPTDFTASLYVNGAPSVAGTNGSFALKIQSGTVALGTGNVGIGTTSPGQKLSVVGSGQATEHILNIASSSGSSLFRVNGSGVLTMLGYSGIQAPVISPEHQSLKFGFQAGSGLDNTFSPIITLGVYSSTFATGPLNISTNPFNGAEPKFSIGSTTPFATFAVNPVGGVASNQFVVGSSSATSFIINNSGNVGIGTANPSATLDLSYSSQYTAIDATKTFRIYNPSSSSVNLVAGVSGNGAIVQGRDGTDSYSLLLNPYGGNVGIGTTNPGYKLHVAGSVIGLFNSGADATQYLGEGEAASTYGGVKWESSDDTMRIFTYDGGESQLVLNESGNVGIGTTNPGMRLHVDSVSSVDIAKFERSGSTSFLRVNANAGMPQMEFSRGGVKSFSVGVDTNTFKISDNTAIGTNDRFVIDTTGNVGIGTTSPQAKLDVEGDIALFNSATSNRVPGGGLRIAAPISSAKYNWMIGAQQNINNGFEITPSTAAGGLSFSTPAFTILGATGNVGIGTTNPGARLHLVDAIGNSQLILGNTSDADNWQFYTPADGDDKSLRIFESASTAGDRFTIEAGGNVGIGTTSPYTKLAVSNNTSDNTAIIESTSGIASLDIKSQSTASVLRINRSDTSAGSQIYLQTAGANNWGIGNGIGRVTSDLQFYDYANAEAMVLKSATGNVGIGTSTPLTRLGVYSTGLEVAEFRSAISSTDPMNIYFSKVRAGNTDSPSDGIVNLIGRKKVSGVDINAAGISYLSNVQIGSSVGEISFNTNNNSSYGERMRLNGNGYLGIGTTTPDAKLTVNNGNIKVGDSTTNNGTIYSTLGTNSFTSNATNGQASSLSIIMNGGLVGAGYNEGAIRFLTGLAGATTEKLTITQGGNIGIGTSTPNSLLQVGGITNVQIDNNGAYSSTYNGEVNPRIQMNRDLFGSGLGGIAFNQSGASTMSANGAGVGLAASQELGFFTTTGSVLAERMRITQVGRVGIGTTSPYAKLSIHANSSETNRALFSVASSTQTSTSTIFTILNNGNIGIGTTSPIAALHVVPVGPAFSATGGTITTSGPYTIHTFTSSGTFTPNGAGTVEYLVVGGGGGGGLGNPGGGAGGGGGGGAGGVRTGSGYAVSATGYTVTVGNGGNGGGTPTSGNNSVFDTVTATGGGRGGNYQSGAGQAGGSGGGGAGSTTVGGSGGAGTVGQGSNGGTGFADGSNPTGAGGGGAGAVGANGTGTGGGNGGAGYLSSISGSAVYYAGGGGGSGWNAGGGSVNGIGGTGGGGNGSHSGTASAGTANTGGGGGGGGVNNPGAGGSGIVIVRYLTEQRPAAVFNGNVGIGTTTPTKTFAVVGSVGFEGLSASAGAGALCLSSSYEVTYSAGATCTVSSGRFKHNITSSDLGLDFVNQLRPVTYEYNSEIGIEGEQFGFIAEEIETLDPRLVVHDVSGDPYSVRYENLTAVLARATQQLDAKVESLATSTPASGSLGERVITNIFTQVKGWLASATNGIGSVFAQTFRASEEICIDDQCLDREDVVALLALVNSGQQGGGNNNGQGTTTPPTDTSLPVISILGDNPSTITVGTTYSDMGATVTDTDENGAINNNLGLLYNVNGVDMANITIDTSATSTHTIIYSAVDGAGNVGTATRIVNVVE